MGIVTKVHKCRFLKINKKQLRKDMTDGAEFWKIITVRYAVDGKIYTRKKLVPPFDACPEKNSNIGVWYDKRKPKKIFLSA